METCEHSRIEESTSASIKQSESFSFQIGCFFNRISLLIFELALYVDTVVKDRLDYDSDNG